MPNKKIPINNIKHNNVIIMLQNDSQQNNIILNDKKLNTNNFLINNKNEKIKKMGNFITRNNCIYKKNIEIMKNNNIKKIWKDFINEYHEYFN